MTLLHWRPYMSVGCEAIDADHKVLINLLNKLHFQLFAGDEPGAIEDVLEDLAAYARAHFAREESLMCRAGYPETERHCALHRSLSSALEAYRRQYHQDRDSFDEAEFYDFVSDWLLIHVLEDDAKLKPYLSRVSRLALAG